MAIDALRDGFIKICFDTSLNTVPDGCRMLVEGQFFDPDLGCDIVPDVPIRVASMRQVDCQFGPGSVLSESLRAAFGCCGNNAVEIWALPREDAALAVKAAFTATVTGPATGPGRVDIYWGDASYNLSVAVADGETATQIALKIKNAILPSFPYTATVAAGVITLTAKNGGTVGNFLNPQVNWHGRLNYFPAGVTIAFAQTVQGSVDPEPLNYADILGECCYCCVAILTDNLAAQDAWIAYLSGAWDCLTPQCFGHGYTYNSGSLGGILSSDTNSAEISRMAHCLTDPTFPFLKVAAYAAQSCCTTIDNPEISIQGPQFGVLSCLSMPESCTACFTYDEMVQLRDAGFVTTTPVNGGSGALTSPQIDNDITNSRFDEEGRVNATFRDVSARRLATETAKALAAQLQTFNGLGLFTRATEIRTGIRGTNPRLILGSMRSWAKDNVGVLFSEFDDIDKDLQVLTDFEVAPKCQGIPGKLYFNMVYRPPVRITNVVSNLSPKLLDNCR